MIENFHFFFKFHRDVSILDCQELIQNRGLLFGIIEIINREDVLFLCMLGHV